jgi:hypothetical protein
MDVMAGKSPFTAPAVPRTPIVQLTLFFTQKGKVAPLLNQVPRNEGV